MDRALCIISYFKWELWFLILAVPINDWTLLSVCGCQLVHPQLRLYYWIRNSRRNTFQSLDINWNYYLNVIKLVYWIDFYDLNYIYPCHVLQKWSLGGFLFEHSCDPKEHNYYHNMWNLLNCNFMGSSSYSHDSILLLWFLDPQSMASLIY